MLVLIVPRIGLVLLFSFYCILVGLIRWDYPMASFDFISSTEKTNKAKGKSNHKIKQSDIAFGIQSILDNNILRYRKMIKYAGNIYRIPNFK